MLKRIWRGNIGLACSFWGVGICGGIICTTVTVFGIEMVYKLAHPHFFHFALGLLCLWLAILVFLSVCVWRSASNCRWALGGWSAKGVILIVWLAGLMAPSIVIIPYRVTVAVAGFGENDLDVTLENETLTISGKKADEAESATYLHRGLAGRNFKLRFNLADHIKVNGANLVNGELVVDLEREVPEALKPRKIDIETHPIKDLAAKAKKLVGIEDKKAA
jgi:hypothetical protein